MKNDAQLAIKAAESMAQRMKQDVAIMMGLSTTLLKDVQELIPGMTHAGEVGHNFKSVLLL